MATSQVSDHAGSAAFLEFKDIIAEVALCSGSSWADFEEEPRNRLLRTPLRHSPRDLKMTQITQLTKDAKLSKKTNMPARTLLSKQT